MSGGRNNSWASAAVGQVGQAYVQKGNDAVSDFADRAYNRLAQRFGVARAKCQTVDLIKNETMFNRSNTMLNTYNQLGQQEYNNNWNDRPKRFTLRNNDLSL